MSGIHDALLKYGKFNSNVQTEQKTFFYAVNGESIRHGLWRNSWLFSCEARVCKSVTKIASMGGL